MELGDLQSEIVFGIAKELAINAFLLQNLQSFCMACKTINKILCTQANVDTNIWFYLIMRDLTPGKYPFVGKNYQKDYMDALNTRPSSSCLIYWASHGGYLNFVRMCVKSIALKKIEWHNSKGGFKIRFADEDDNCICSTITKSLEEVSCRGYKDIVIELLTTFTTTYGDSELDQSLINACENGHDEILGILLDYCDKIGYAGVNISRCEQLDTDIIDTDEEEIDDERDLLIMAVASGYMKCVKLLVDRNFTISHSSFQTAMFSVESENIWMLLADSINSIEKIINWMPVGNFSIYDEPIKYMINKSSGSNITKQIIAKLKKKKFDYTIKWIEKTYPKIYRHVNHKRSKSKRKAARK